jgi:hypothetical protein
MYLIWTFGVNCEHRYAIPECLNSKGTEFLFNYVLCLPEITSFLLQIMTLGKLHSGSSVSSTDQSNPGNHFLYVCIGHRLQYFVCLLSSQNNDPSISILISGRGRNRTGLDLGCREDVEVLECFSSPEILELKAQCELVRYRGEAPSRLQCPFGLAGSVFFESFVPPKNHSSR